MAADIAERTGGARIGAISIYWTSAYVIPLRIVYWTNGLCAGPWMDQIKPLR